MQVEEQIRRSEFEFPTLTISKKLETVADIESLEFSDFVIKNYKCHPAIKAEMAI